MSFSFLTDVRFDEEVAVGLPNDCSEHEVMLRFDVPDKRDKEFDTYMVDSYYIVEWFGISHFEQIHDTDVFRFIQVIHLRFNQC